MKQPPSLGHIVHIHLQQIVGDIAHHHVATKACAAMITDVDLGQGGAVSLVVFEPGAELRHLSHVPFAEVPTPNHWSWPPMMSPAAPSPSKPSAGGI